jgi:hypothetical protein
MGLLHRFLLLCLSSALTLSPWTAAARAEPAVARPVIAFSNQTLKASTVFFLEANGDPGVVAVGAAHAFDLGRLAQAGAVRFQLVRSERMVGISTRFYVQPGRSFRAPGGSLRSDYVIFALDSAPFHVRTLQAGAELPKKGTRVQLLGVPSTIPQDEDDVFGFVTAVSEARIEVDLDVPVDLRGWGGAPVLDHASGQVIGILQAAVPGDTKLGIVASPIAAVLDAMGDPFERGRGRPFASVVDPEPAPEAPAAAPPSRPAPDEPTRTAATAARQSTGQPAAEPAPGQASPAGEPAYSEDWWQRRTGGDAAERKRILDPDLGTTRILLEIEHPYDGAVFGAEAGAFVAGRAMALRGDFKRFDVVLVLDTSGSTKDMSGADINSNGIVGENRAGGLFGSTDSGDSILAAEVAAAKQLLTGLDPRNTRVGLISFAGDASQGGGFFGQRTRPPAITEEPLTQDYARIERALDSVLARGPDGLTHMKAGVEQAVIELIGARGGVSEPDAESEKVVLFLTDGQPTLPYDPMMRADNTRAVFRAADQARRAGVRIHSFAIGPEALDGPTAAVEMAKRTHGYFTPVRHPGDLVDLIEEVNFANLRSIRVKNLTTERESKLVDKKPDGSWSSLVPLTIGKNRIEVTVEATDGTESSHEIEVAYAPGSADPALATELLPRRSALLEQRLIELRRERKDIEIEAIEHSRKELILEMERERSRAEVRAEEQRKELDIEIQPDE